jgi:hypothetical protein
VAVGEIIVIVESKVSVEAIVTGVYWVVVTVEDTCVIVEVNVEVEVWLEVRLVADVTVNVETSVEVDGLVTVETSV